MIKEFTLKNFRSFGEEEQTIKIRPITLIFGENSVGKSSIFNAINILKNSIHQNEKDIKNIDLRHRLDMPIINNSNNFFYNRNLVGRRDDNTFYLRHPDVNEKGKKFYFQRLLPRWYNNAIINREKLENFIIFLENNTSYSKMEIYAKINDIIKDQKKINGNVIDEVQAIPNLIDYLEEKEQTDLLSKYSFKPENFYMPKFTDIGFEFSITLSPVNYKISSFYDFLYLDYKFANINHIYSKYTFKFSNYYENGYSILNKQTVVANDEQNPYSSSPYPILELLSKETKLKQSQLDIRSEKETDISNSKKDSPYVTTNIKFERNYNRNFVISPVFSKIFSNIGFSPKLLNKFASEYLQSITNEFGQLEIEDNILEYILFIPPYFQFDLLGNVKKHEIDMLKTIYNEVYHENFLFIFFNRNNGYIIIEEQPNMLHEYFLRTSKIIKFDLSTKEFGQLEIEINKKYSHWIIDHIIHIADYYCMLKELQKHADRFNIDGINDINGIYHPSYRLNTPNNILEYQTLNNNSYELIIDFPDPATFMDYQEYEEYETKFYDHSIPLRMVIPINHYLIENEDEIKGIYASPKVKDLFMSLELLLFQPPIFKLKDSFQNITHIPPIRSRQEFHGEITDGLSKNSPNILLYQISTNQQYLEKFNNYLDILDLGYHLLYFDPTITPFKVGLIDLYTKTKTHLSEVGYGISQILPIIAQMVLSDISSKNQNYLFIEQPEIHLNPKIQGDLSKVFSKFINLGKQKNKVNNVLTEDQFHKNNVIIETHSEYFILALKGLVRSGQLNPEDIIINYVSKGDEGSYVTHIEIDEDGHFTTEWPDKLFDYSYEFLSR